jgi:hypothetical protein
MSETLYGEEIPDFTYVKSGYGTNQKKSGDLLEKILYNKIREKHPNALIKTQVNIEGSLLKSIGTGKMRRRRYKVDILLNDDTVISVKNQNEKGTVQNKLSDEQMYISDMFRNNPQLKHAYIVYKPGAITIVDEEYEWLPDFKEMREKYSWIKILKVEDFMEEI